MVQCFDGADTLEVSRGDGFVRVCFRSGQINKDSLSLIGDRLTLEDEAPEGFEASIKYELPEAAVSLSEAIGRASSRLDRLRLAQKLVGLLPRSGSWRVPFLHPGNIWLVGDRVFVAHHGLRRFTAPMGVDDGRVLDSYRALVLAVLNPKISFEKLVVSVASLDDRFARKVVSFEDVDGLAGFIDLEVVREEARVSKELSLVPRGRYRFVLVAGACLLVAAVVGCGFGIVSSLQGQKKDAIITSQNYFVTQDYTDSFNALNDYSPDQLSKASKYTLAVASVNLSNLTQSQKQVVLGGLSSKTDDNTLDYWVYLGRGDFDKALDLAQNLNDDQLTLLAYTDLYEYTKLNSRMDGAKKQQLLQDYMKKINDLTAKLGQGQGQ